MGFLTDVRGGQNVITDTLIKWHNVICCILYLGGIGLFLALAHDSLNNKTYFSENALLPGLVHNEFHDENLAITLHEELLVEQKKYPNGIPYAWFNAKFSQLGLDVYTHNFSLDYPLQEGKRFQGKNVYGIVRAPRASSTEALVLSTPYRPPNSIHSTTAPSVALMLSFAKFCKQQKYWAKDIIFLIVEHEQLGTQAWLEAYLGIEKSKSSPLKSGILLGRAGAIQAAINLEFHDPKIGYIDIKIEGLNGQLPNLDLVNLANRIATMERIRHTFKGRSQSKKTDPFQNWLHSFETLGSMVLTMATGVPTGNHGLYHRYGIEAITLEGFPREGSQSYVTYYILGRLLEGMFRSLNNLLERFHQSYFFYLLPSLSRFVSIGTYIGSLVAFAAVLLIKALVLWLQIREKPEIVAMYSNQTTYAHSPSNQGDGKPSEKKTRFKLVNKGGGDDVKEDSIPQVDDLYFETPETNKIGLIFILSHAIGIGAMNIPTLMTNYFGSLDYSTEQVLFYGLGVIAIATLILSFFIKLQNYKSVIVLNIIALLELATVLTAVGLQNFSLGFLIGAIYVPWIIAISPVSNRSKLRYATQIFGWVLFHPMIVGIVIVLIYTWIMFPEETAKEVFWRGIGATQHALTFTVVDSLIYGNWLFNVVTTLFIPNWLCFYSMFFYKPQVVKIKTN